MPYHVGGKGTNGCSGYPVVSDKGHVMGCHDTEEQANAQVGALYANEPGLKKETEMETEKRDYSTRSRERMATEGQAMPDGSFPIANASDLHNAIQSVGRAKDYEAAKQHIMRRARALGLVDQLPEDWKNKATKGMTGWGGTVFDLNPFVK